MSAPTALVERDPGRARTDPAHTARQTWNLTRSDAYLTPLPPDAASRRPGTPASGNGPRAWPPSTS